MARDPLILAIDIGTSAVKAGLFDKLLRLRSVASAAYRVDRPQPGWVEVPPKRWWSAMLRAVRRLDQAGLAKRVEGITFSTLYPGLILTDEQFRPLRPAILYCDTRSGAEAQAFERRVGRDQLLLRTGSAVHPGTPALSSLVWIARHEPGVIERTRHLLMPNSYLAARLTGRVKMDYNTASISGLLDIRALPTWWTGLADKAGLDKAALPDLALAHDTVGTLSTAAGGFLDLRAGVPVVIGGGDSACSALAGGLLRRGKVVVACGSTDTAATCTRARPLPSGFINVVHVVPSMRQQTCLVQASLSSSGVSVDWITRELYGRQRGALERALAEAETVPAGAGGLVFLPYLQGERTPIWSDRARGVLVGLSPTTTRAAVVRATLEGVAFALRHNMEALEAAVGKLSRTVTLVGGGARSRLLNQIRADVMARPMRRLCLGDVEGSESLAGAAMLAAVGLGHVASFARAVSLVNRSARQEWFRPQASAVERYEQLYRVYRDLYPALEATFEDLHNLESG